jgi:hypothetical protein
LNEGKQKEMKNISKEQKGMNKVRKKERGSHRVDGRNLIRKKQK